MFGYEAPTSQVYKINKQCSTDLKTAAGSVKNVINLQKEQKNCWIAEFIYHQSCF